RGRDDGRLVEPAGQGRARGRGGQHHRRGLGWRNRLLRAAPGERAGPHGEPDGQELHPYSLVFCIPDTPALRGVSCHLAPKPRRSTECRDRPRAARGWRQAAEAVGRVRAPPRLVWSGPSRFVAADTNVLAAFPSSKLPRKVGVFRNLMVSDPSRSYTTVAPSSSTPSRTRTTREPTSFPARSCAITVMRDPASSSEIESGSRPAPRRGVRSRWASRQRSTRAARSAASRFPRVRPRAHRRPT